jgi:hypothetical protein
MMNYKRPYENRKRKKKLIVSGSAQQCKAQIIFMFWLDVVCFESMCITCWPLAPNMHWHNQIIA